jgi:hypothetical protein
MTVQQLNEGFVFSVVEDDGDYVTIEVSKEDYLREKAAGVEEESLLKPGQYKLKHGGFIVRHSKMKPRQRRKA